MWGGGFLARIYNRRGFGITVFFFFFHRRRRVKDLWDFEFCPVKGGSNKREVIFVWFCQGGKGRCIFFGGDGMIGERINKLIVIILA